MNEPLRLVPLMADVPESYLRALASGVQEIKISPGEYLFHEGNPADDVYFLLGGELELTKVVGGVEEVHSRVAADDLCGQMAIMPSSPYSVSARAATQVLVVAMPAMAMRRMVNATAEAGARQVEKLTALGRLAAGLAHELNNPAAAARRAAHQLRTTLAGLYNIGMDLHKYKLSEAQWEYLRDLQQELVRHAAEAQPLPPLNQSDREEQASAWLESHGLEDGWRLAPIVVRAGWDLARLDEISQHLPVESMRDVIPWICGTQSVVDLQREIEVSTESISDLIDAVKAYSYMDRNPDHDVDLNEGIENTLTILGHKLRQGVTVHREYDRELPRIRAWSNELNQVWTNLIDNAIDATHGRGQVWIRTRREGDQVEVEIADDGDGIPMDLQSRIFEPFFTTKGKEQAKGAGLGLDIARRIVTERYGGDISFRSSPGNTRFFVRLPLNGHVAQPVSAEEANSRLRAGEAA